MLERGELTLLMDPEKYSALEVPLQKKLRISGLECPTVIRGDHVEIHTQPLHNQSTFFFLVLKSS